MVWVLKLWLSQH